MTQPSRGRSGIYQVLVFLIILALVLIALIAGGSGNPSGATRTAEVTAAITSEATATATVEATSAATSEATTAVTVEATTAVTSEATIAVTSESTAAATATAEATMALTAEATAQATTAAAAPRVYFRVPSDNAIVPPKFTVEMGADGLTVEPAGAVHDGAGHFHILIDTPFIEAGQVIPKDDTHLHFGQGQTEAQLTLTPGKHVLRLQFANGAHVALAGDQYRAEITVNVSAGS